MQMLELDQEIKTKFMKYLLVKVINDYRQMLQWEIDENVMNRLQYFHYVEAILEEIEILHCGSVGGYAEGQKDKSLFGRIQFFYDYLRLKKDDLFHPKDWLICQMYYSNNKRNIDNIGQVLKFLEER
jgi:hypothetical protein